MPMPHSGARGSPVIDVRVVPDASCPNAAATLVPARTCQGVPLTVICTAVELNGFMNCSDWPKQQSVQAHTA